MVTVIPFSGKAKNGRKDNSVEERCKWANRAGYERRGENNEEEMRRESLFVKGNI